MAPVQLSNGTGTPRIRVSGLLQAQRRSLGQGSCRVLGAPAMLCALLVAGLGETA